MVWTPLTFIKKKEKKKKNLHHWLCWRLRWDGWLTVLKHWKDLCTLPLSSREWWQTRKMQFVHFIISHTSPIWPELGFMLDKHPHKLSPKATLTLILPHYGILWRVNVLSHLFSLALCPWDRKTGPFFFFLKLTKFLKSISASSFDAFTQITYNLCRM